MSDAESDEELPSINFHSLSQEIKQEAMPTASEVAAAREREQRTAAELARLREPAAGDRRASSSGSEGEASLAAAVRRLRVLPPPARRHSTSPARRLLASLPPPAAHATRHLAAAFRDDAGPAARAALVDQVSRGLSAAGLRPENTWSDDSAVWGAGVLCACVWAGGAGAARRALRRLLARASAAAVRRLAALLRRAAGRGAGAARALLRLAGATRALPPPAHALHAALLRHGLYALLRPDVHPQDDEEAMESSTETLERALSGPRPPVLDAASRRLALALAARAARAAGAGGGGEGGEGATPRLLAALAQPPKHKDKHHPDCLKLAAASSTLQLVFRAAPAPAAPAVHLL